MESVNIPVDADLNFVVLTAKPEYDDGDDVGDSGVEDDDMGDEGNGFDTDSCGDDTNADECVIDGMEVGTAG